MHGTLEESPGNREYFERFNLETMRLRVPVTGGYEITHRCNLACIHCYLGPGCQHRKHEQEELSTARALAMLDEITEAGCLHFLITGGEPLLRKDFPEIYSRAKTNGLLVTVFTNGTLLTDEHADLFRDLPPQSIEISVYGATAATYEGITGVEGSYRRCLAGIERLLRKPVNVLLKTVIMKPNQHEFHAIEALAKGFGVKFRCDAQVFPSFGGDMTPLALRVPSRDAVALEFSDAKRRGEWQTFHERTSASVDSGRLFTCGAGISTFHIDSSGRVSPCLMTPNPSFTLAERSFLDGWNTVIGTIREKQAAADFPCNGCSRKMLCGYCPGFFALENGAEHLPSEYLCAMGESRYRALTPGGTVSVTHQPPG